MEKLKTILIIVGLMAVDVMKKAYEWILKHKKLLIIAALVIVGMTLNYYFGFPSTGK